MHRVHKTPINRHRRTMPTAIPTKAKDCTCTEGQPKSVARFGLRWAPKHPKTAPQIVQSQPVVMKTSENLENETGTGTTQRSQRTRRESNELPINEGTREFEGIRDADSPATLGSGLCGQKRHR